MFYTWIFFFFSQPHLMWPQRRSLLGKKYTGAQKWGAARIIRTDISTTGRGGLPAHFYFSQGVNKCEILPHFSIPFTFRALGFKNRAKTQKFKTIVYNINICALIFHRTCAASELMSAKWLTVNIELSRTLILNLPIQGPIREGQILQHRYRTI